MSDKLLFYEVPLSLVDIYIYVYIMALRMNYFKISNFTYNISYVCSANNEGVKNKDRAILTNKSKIITILVGIVVYVSKPFLIQ